MATESVTVYETEANNRLTADASYDYAYDGEGNRVRRFERATAIEEIYEWDNRNRLVRVYTLNNSGELIEDVRYTYDVFDRRIGRSNGSRRCRAGATGGSTICL